MVGVSLCVSVVQPCALRPLREYVRGSDDIFLLVFLVLLTKSFFFSGMHVCASRGVESVSSISAPLPLLVYASDTPPRSSAAWLHLCDVFDFSSLFLLRAPDALPYVCGRDALFRHRDV